MQVEHERFGRKSHFGKLLLAKSLITETDLNLIQALSRLSDYFDYPTILKLLEETAGA
jgi:hypothetical protein